MSNKKLIKEVRGISFEVRAWAIIINDRIKSEYQKYWDDYNERMKSQRATYQLPTKNDSFSRQSLDNFDFSGYLGYGEKITKGDLSVMDPMEIDDVFETIIFYHKIRYDEIFDMSGDEIAELYNQTLDSTPIKEGVSGDAIPKPKQIIINGSDYPDAFSKFAVDKWVITNQQPTEYDHVNSGYQSNGEYTVFINCSMDNVSMFVLIHEIKHAYQDWQRQSKNRPAIRNSKEVEQLYTKDFEKYILSHRAGYDLTTMESIISAYYMSSNAEITAYLEGIYDELYSGEKQPASGLYQLGLKMMKFKKVNIEASTQPEILQKKWTSIINDYDVPLFRKFKSVFDFLKYTERKFNQKGRYIVSKIDKLRTLDNN